MKLTNEQKICICHNPIVIIITYKQIWSIFAMLANNERRCWHDIVLSSCFLPLECSLHWQAGASYLSEFISIKLQCCHIKTLIVLTYQYLDAWRDNVPLVLQRMSSLTKIPNQYNVFELSCHITVIFTRTVTIAS